MAIKHREQLYDLKTNSTSKELWGKQLQMLAFLAQGTSPLVTTEASRSSD